MSETEKDKPLNYETVYEMRHKSVKYSEVPNTSDTNGIGISEKNFGWKLKTFAFFFCLLLDHPFKCGYKKKIVIDLWNIVLIKLVITTFRRNSSCLIPPD